MKVLSLSARNLRTWEVLDFDVPEGVVAIVGPNGAGKSSLVSVVDLALFGSPGRELKPMTTRGFDDVEVSLRFSHGDTEYKVRRGYSNGKGYLDLFDTTDAETLTGPTVSDTQERIEELLGLSRATFRASAYLAQGDGAAFTMAEPRERKAILLDALGVSVWDRLKAKVADRRAEHERALGVMLSSTERLAGEVAQRDALVMARGVAALKAEPLKMQVDDIERGLAGLRDEIAAGVEAAAKRTEAEQRLRHARELVAEMMQTVGRIEERIGEASRENGYKGDKALAACEPHLARIIELRREADAEGRELDLVAKNAEDQREREAAFTQKADEFGEQLAKVETCPTCEQELRGEALKRAKAKLEQARDGSLKEAIDAAKRGHAAEVQLDEGAVRQRERLKEEVRLKELLPDSVSVQTPSLSLTRAQEAAQRIALADERRSQLAREKDDLAAATAALAARQEALRQVEEEVRSTPQPPDLGALRNREQTAEVKLTVARDNAREAENRLVRLDEQVRRLDIVAEELVELQREVDVEKDNVALLSCAERAYGRDGIPALILETSAIPQIEAEADRIVAELGRPYHFELRTQRETQAGTAKEVLDIVVHTGDGEATYEDFSGGERTRLDVALRIALARLLAARRGTDVRLLAIDEPAYLDDEGFAQLADVLRGLAGEFDTVLVVSHVEALKDAFDSSVTVGGGADTGEPSRLERGAS